MACVGLRDRFYEEAAQKRALVARAAQGVVLGSGRELRAASSQALVPVHSLAAPGVAAAAPLKTQAVFTALGIQVSLAA